MKSHDQVIDTIICGATVDLFHSWGVGVAPGRPTDRPPSSPLPDVAASVDFRGDNFSGSLHLCCPSRLQRSDDQQEARHPGAGDWVRELSNQLTGNIKRRFKQSEVQLSTSLPRTAHRGILQRRIDRALPMRFYEFRTRCGIALLILEGKMDGSKIRYSGGPAIGAEDGVIIFEDEPDE